MGIQIKLVCFEFLLIISQIAALPFVQDLLRCRFLTMSRKGLVDSRMVPFAGGYSQWVLNNTLDGYYLIINQRSGYYLTGDARSRSVYGLFSTDYYDDQSPTFENQKWIIQNDDRVTQGAFLIHKASGLRLDYNLSNLQVFLAKPILSLSQIWSVNPNNPNQKSLLTTTTTTRTTTTTTTTAKTSNNKLINNSKQ